ncbi:hypothetical protein NMS_0206 [Nonlabens marinus S1-08]|uniref:P/Homo B domain-containing protein n=2 Tax=Nonlabens TaxID=363408 RepID=W8VP31_9FLAO|nr:hypothetical protein NMS_0206 [Nonlabens marinus S1-08]
MVQGQELWVQSSKGALSKIPVEQRKIIPEEFETYNLDIAQLSTKLENAVDRFSGGASIAINFPVGGNEFESFEVFNAGSMEKALEEKYPNIRSYYGYSSDNTLNKIYFTITPKGFHGLIRGERIVHMDPYASSAKNSIMVYDRKDLKRDAQELFECETQDSGLNVEPLANPNNIAKAFEDLTFHTYRMAISATSEYTAYHNDNDASNGDAYSDALSGIVITLARVNSVFEQEISIRFTLVGNNDLLIYHLGRNKNNRSENFDNFSANQMIGANTGEINAVIGSGAYDIGHIFSTGGGGVASNSRCSNTTKGRGVTGIVTPEFDPFDIDYVSHEIGHQFGASHTFYNGCFGGSPSPQPFETGSASTIMGYAGICAPNVQDNSDAYFHLISLFEMQGQLANDACDVETNLKPLNDTAPNSVSFTETTIPKSTPFKLIGSSTTAPDSGEQYTYNWEQLDTGTAAQTGATQPPVATNSTGPMFRSKFATIDPTRYFPNLPDLANGIDPKWETLPSVERSMRFFCTIRDNNPNGGQTSYGGVTLTVGAAGPLTVSNPANNIWYAGSSETITWQVNGTGTATYSENVNIKLSTDGGLTYPITLLANTSNDGSAAITVPTGVLSTKARIMVEASNNYFFNINSGNFEIKAATFEIATVSTLLASCSPSDTTLVFDYDAAPGFTELAVFTAQDLPSGISAAFDQNNVSTDATAIMTISNTSTVAPGAYPFKLVVTTASATVEKELTLKIFNNSIGEVQLTSPVNGAQNQVSNPILSWEDLGSAATYIVQISLNPDFSTITETINVGNATSYQPTNLLPGQIYYWSVKPFNDCIAGEFTTVYAFQTAQEVCKSYANATFFNENSTQNDQWATNSNNAVSAYINIPDDIEVTDVSFSMKATHSDTGDLKMQFRAPSGTFSEVYNRECAAGRNIDVTVTDNATQAFGCDPGYTGALMGDVLPGQAFTRFHGQSAKGQWELLVTDREADSNGGTFELFKINVCGRLQYVNEFNSTVNSLTAGFDQSTTVDASNLNITQTGTATNALIYVITKVPVYGTIQLNGIDLTMGDTFTQADIDSGSIAYQHTSTQLIYTDQMTYVVKGVDGTLSTATSLPIAIDTPVLIYNNGWTPFAPSSDTETLVARVVSGSPSITTAASVLDLEVSSGQSISIQSPLTVKGNMNIAGELTTTGSGTIEFQSTTAQTIQGGGSIAINDLFLNNTVGVSLQSEVTVHNVLYPNNSILTTNGNLVFNSDASGTAQLANAENATINGAVTVERYIPARRAYRLLSSPVTSTGSIYENWQENGVYTAGLGTHITGSKTGANGFDATATGNASLYLFDNNNYQWIKTPNTDTDVLTAGTGYRLLVRGDRSTDLTINTPAPTPTVLRAMGTLSTGNFDASFTTADQEFALLGNPYQANIDGKQLINATTTLGISQTFLYVWDPNLNERGGYVTLDMDTENGTPTPSASVANKYIQPGQAFFVKTTGPSSIRFVEQFKAVETASLAVFSTTETRPEIKVSISNSLQSNMDEVRIVFSDSYENEVTDADATKFYNQDETLATSNGGTLLSVEKRKLPLESDVIPLHMDQLRYMEYTLGILIEDRMNLNPILIDQFENTQMELSDSNTSIDFTITEDPASRAKDRFLITFDKSTLGTTNAQISGWDLYPNPAKNHEFTIANYNATGSVMQLQLINTLGQLVFKKEYSFNGLQQVQLDPNIAAGVYMLQIEASGRSQTFRLIVE